MEGEAQARPDVVAAVNLGVGNGRVESINQKIKVAIDSGYGFRNVGSLSPIVTLRCSDENPAMSWGLEGREAKEGREEEGGGTGRAAGRGGRRGCSRTRSYWQFPRSRTLSKTLFRCRAVNSAPLPPHGPMLG